MTRASSAGVATAGPRPPAPTCTAADLAINGADTDFYSDANSNDFDTRISLRNISRATCRLGGWPGIEFLGQAVIYSCPTGTPGCGPPDSTSPNPVTVTDSHRGTPTEITLPPGADTFFVVLWMPAYDAGTSATPICDYNPTIDPYIMQIRLPGDSRPLTWVVNIGRNSTMILCSYGDVQVTAFGVAA